MKIFEILNNRCIDRQICFIFKNGFQWSNYTVQIFFCWFVVEVQKCFLIEKVLSLDKQKKHYTSL